MNNTYMKLYFSHVWKRVEKNIGKKSTNIFFVPSQRYQDPRHLFQNPNVHHRIMGFSNRAQWFTTPYYSDFFFFLIGEGEDGNSYQAAGCYDDSRGIQQFPLFPLPLFYFSPPPPFPPLHPRKQTPCHPVISWTLWNIWSAWHQGAARITSLCRLVFTTKYLQDIAAAWIHTWSSNPADIIKAKKT